MNLLTRYAVRFHAYDMVQLVLFRYVDLSEKLYLLTCGTIELGLTFQFKFRISIKVFVIARLILLFGYEKKVTYLRSKIDVELIGFFVSSKLKTSIEAAFIVWPA